MTTLRFAEKLRDLVGGVDVVLSDVWGVVHNGLVAFPEACEALHNFRVQGGTVILITHAPRPAGAGSCRLLPGPIRRLNGICRRLSCDDAAGTRAQADAGLRQSRHHG